MSDLDSFFAKKDKKKGKTGKKFATTEELAKTLEDVSLRKDKAKKDKNQYVHLDVTNNSGENEDEWKEFQEDKKDYTGLKIQPLILSENDQNDTDKGQSDSNEEGTDGSDGAKKKAAGPWKMNDVQNESAAAPAEPSPPVQANKGSSGGLYVNPIQKQVLGLTQPREKSKAAPDMNSTVVFPTLQSAKSGPKPTESVWNKRKEEQEMRLNSSNSDGRNAQTGSSSNSSNSGVYCPPQRRAH